MADILNSEQKKAVEHGNGPLLIIAGAGTGKTTVVTERIKYLILKKGVLPSQILALTFTQKAADEMEERVDIAMPYGYTQMWISTFHAFCDRILRNEAVHIGLNPAYVLNNEAESIQFLRKNIFKLVLNYFRPLGNPNKFLSGLLQHFSRLKDEDVSSEEYLEYSRKFKVQNAKFKTTQEEIEKNIELAKAFKTYEEMKIKEGMMDFSDLISNTLKLFRTRKNILRNYQDQFKYILVDEFQDTNFAQNTLAILLARGEKNITVVGDDDQAIYRWRGAAISNIIQFRKKFPEAKVVTLTRNYRSTQEILDKSYMLIQNNNPDRLEAKERINKKLTSERKITGKKIEFLYATRVENEAELVVNKIKELIKNKKNDYKDIAILVRANDHSQPFVRSFVRNDIPYQFLGPGRLFHQEEIKDLIAYLKVLYNFEDSTSLYRVLTLPIFDFEGIHLAVLLNLAKKRNYTLFEAMEKVDDTFLKEEVKEKVKKIVVMIKKHLKQIPRQSAGQILYYFLEDSGILRKMVDLKSQKDEKRYQNIAKFFDKLKTYEAEHEDTSIFAIVDWIDLSMQMGEGPLASDIDWTQNNAVNILTIHSSKGLEFPIVFLVNLVSQRFPTRERSEQIPIPQELIKEILPEGDYHLQEERRLFYVGLTRAKNNLFLTASSFYGEGKRERKISPFVYETLGKDVVEKTLGQQPDKEIKQLNLIEWAEIKPSSQLSTLNSQLSTPVTYLSYSQLQTFDICPLHYKLKYLLKIPVPQTSAQSFGTSIHSTLRDFYQALIREEKPKVNDYIKILDKNWVNEGYASKSHEKDAFEKAKKIISNYLKNNFSSKNIPISLELPFNFFIKNLKIGGRIDRIDKIDENKIEILDYKTGSNILDEKKMKNDLQLTFYALAATRVNDKRLNKKPGDVLLSLYFLEKEVKLTTVRTEEQLKAAEEEILQKAEEISKSDFACSRSSICTSCEYKILCQS